MAALFPPWTNTATRIVLGVVATPILYARSPYATGAGDPLLQPIAFDHRHHVRDDGIDLALRCVHAVRGRRARRTARRAAIVAGT